MTLKEYKEKYGLKNSYLAKLFKVSEGSIYLWTTGYCKPCYKNAAFICKKTNGEVTLQGLGIV